MLVIYNHYTTDHIMQVAFVLCNIFSVASYIISFITGNLSQVDRVWTLLPPFYSWLFVYYEYSVYGFSSPVAKYRLLIIASLITLWTLRLTFNSIRRGYYNKGTEDYRWEYVRRFFKYPKHNVLFQIFNLVFVAFYQHWLILSFTLPVWYVQKYGRTEPLNVLDGVCTGLFLVFLVIEALSDQQQWRYQSTKYKWLETKKYDKNCGYTEADLKRGFFTKGLFAYSRHPNFFAEQSIWWVVYLFTVATKYGSLIKGDFSVLYNESIFGAALLTMLIFASTMLTERISCSKYPDYKYYQKSVSKFLPLWPSKEKI